VTRVALRVGEAVLLPTAGLIVGLVLAPGRAELWAHLYLIALLAIALATVVSVLRGTQPPAGDSSFDAALRREQRPQERLPELARLEREVTLAASSSFDRHYRLRPIAREIAGGLLAARRGVVLDQEPDRSRALLGEETWSLVRPDLEPPHDRYGPGIQAAELGRVLAALEAL
jgi:hypothetical protein